VVVKTVNGTVIRLTDIATARPGVRNSRAAGWYNKDPSVLLIITKQGNANVLDTIDRIYELLPQLKQWVPAGLDMDDPWTARHCVDATEALARSCVDWGLDARKRAGLA